MDLVLIELILSSKKEILMKTKNEGYHSQKNQYLSYVETDKTMVEFNYLDYVLKKDNEEIYLEYKFIENELTKGIVESREVKQKVLVDINTKSIEKYEKKIVIEYNLELEEYRLEIKWRNL